MLALRGICKRFPGVVALDDVSLDVAPGEVLAVIGENGAGKSTLMKVLGGVYEPDAGQIFIDGGAVVFRSPADALGQGIRVIYQELSVLDNLDIAGNVFLGREKRRGWRLDERAMREETARILKRLGMRLAPETNTGELSLAERQMVEIARALSMDCRILVLDEPTSSLTLEETQSLLDLVRELRGQGVSILYISHRLDEIGQIADRVTVLRDGRNVGELTKEQITHDAMVSLMVGRDLAPSGARGGICGDPRLRLKGMRTQRYPERSIDLDVCGGEILGMAGLVGAGRTELARAAFGVDACVGSIEVDGRPLRIAMPHDAIEAGIFLIPEDRRGCGLIVDMSVGENISMPNLPGLCRLGLVEKTRERIYAQAGVDRGGVKAATLDTCAATLSGGNQQKVVISRWLSLNPKVLIFDEPTRGIDVGSKAEIYAEMRRLADSGVAIWMISSDMEEVLAVSDRIVVLHEGRIVGSLKGSDATEEAVMKLAVGGSA